MLDSGIVDVNQSGAENSINEFHRCFYERPIDYDQYSVMRGFDEAGVLLTTLKQCNGLQQCQVFIHNSRFGLGPADRNYD